VEQEIPKSVREAAVDREDVGDRLLANPDPDRAHQHEPGDALRVARGDLGCDPPAELGPYTIGFLSVTLGDLRKAMRIAVSVNVFALAFAALAARHVARDEATRLPRARAAGEVFEVSESA
jgi:hypothetical protein